MVILVNFLLFLYSNSEIKNIKNCEGKTNDCIKSNRSTAVNKQMCREK